MSPINLVEEKVNFKEIILGGCGVAASAVSFWLWKAQAIPAIVAGDFQGGTRFIAPVLGLALSATLFGMGAMFIRDRRVAYCSAIIASVIPFFYIQATAVAAALMGISVFGIAFAVRKIRREFSLSLGFSVSKILKSGLALYFTVAAMTISLFYARTLDQKNTLAALLPKPAFDFTLHHFLNSPFARGITGLPEMQKDTSADEMLDMLARAQLKNQGVSAEKIPPAERARLRQAAHDDIARQYGISFQGDEKVQDVFYTAIAQRADELLGPYRAYLPLVSALAFFFALKALALPLSLAALIFAFLLTRLLISANILKRATQNIEVERITF